MKLKAKDRLLLVLVGISLLLIPHLIPPGWAPLTGTISTNPTTVNLGQTVFVTFSFSGSSASSPHTFRITVTKPSGTGSAWINVGVVSNSSGGGVGATQYPGPGWTTTSGTANTDVVGTYNVVLDKLSPSPTQTGVATTTFAATNRLTVTVVSPAVSNVTRGDTVTISGSVVDVNGSPVTTATVSATTPSSTISLSPTVPSGTYSSQYQVQRNDPLGGWNITIVATSPGGNLGSSSYVVNLLAAQLIVQNLATYNSYGTPIADFSPGDTLYTTFRIAYSGSGFLTSGTFSIQVRGPSGGTVATLQAIYDQNRGLFYTPSGFQVSAADPEGAWQLSIPAGSLSDNYGNTGPSIEVTYRFQVRQDQFIVSQFYLIVAGLAGAGSLGTVLMFRRFNMKTVPFENFFKLTGGEIQPPVSLLIIGDAGAGSTVFALQLLYRDLKSGKFCGLLSYDSFPSEIKRRMRDMGWDIGPYLESGVLTILDCYSALAGIEDSVIRDPTDFTEVSIRVTGMIEKSKWPPTILLDSATPIFNSAAAKDCINFLQVIGAKVKNNGGMFIITATKGSIPEEARSKIESLADGVIELGLIKRAKGLARTITVKKISGRDISSTETEFTVVAGKGIFLKKQRIPISIFRPK